MVEEIQSIRSAIDDLRDSADDMERALNAVAEDGNSLMSRVSWIEAENAKLRDELAKWERLADGIDLPEYPVTQFKPKDLERENAKLRKLVRHMGACIQYLDRSEEDGGCVLCPYQSVEHDCEFESRMLELGIEV